MTHVTCPGCHRLIAVKNDERVRCSPCIDIVSFRTDEAAGMTYYYNERNQLVDRKPIRTGTLNPYPNQGLNLGRTVYSGFGVK